MPDLSLTIQPPAELAVTVVPPQPVSTALSVGQGPAGPQGPQGLPGGQVQLVAASTINGHRAIAANADGQAIHADALTRAHALAIVGITEQAANVGESLQVRSTGSITHAGWSWTAGPVLLGAAGNLVQSLPVGALFALPIGWGDGDTLTLNIQPPIYLGA